MKRKKLENDRRNNLLASSNDPKRFWETLKSAKPRIQNDANYIIYIDGEKWFAYFRNSQLKNARVSLQLTILYYLTTLLKPKS